MLQPRLAPSARRVGFTLIELLVVISIIALLIGILLPALGAARTAARQMKSNTQLRGIHQAMASFSQSNNDLFPGMDKYAESSDEAFTDSDDIRTYEVPGPGFKPRAGAFIGARYALLLERDYLDQEILKSPQEEVERSSWYPDPVSELGRQHQQNDFFYSYSLLQIIQTPGFAFTAKWRAQQWGLYLNPSSIVAGDRLTGGDVGDPATHLGLWNDAPGEWQGGLLYNDGHAEWTRSSIVGQTNYRANDYFQNDNIFFAPGANNPFAGTNQTKLISNNFGSPIQPVP